VRCPYCAAENTQVRDSRPTEDGVSIRRRRACTVCGGRFTTFERVQLRELTVVKRSGKREPFDRDKLLRSVAIAARKRDIDEEVLERMVSGIVRQLESAGDAEVPAARIGELAMEALRQIDDVAYVRFASVYRNFSEARDFEAFVADLARTVKARAGAGEDQPGVE
jgi:transcriptional repressor NrdR